MQICIVYDCLFPWTIGGAERWYRNLAERLSAQGHELTYLTLRQWDADDIPRISGVTVVPVGPRMELYDRERRAIAPPLRFGLGVLLHLLRYGRRYDVVHTASFPFFSLLAIGMTRPLCRFHVICDWHEVWTRDYWRRYLGPLAGEAGWLIQRLCARVPQQAYTFSRLHARRLAVHGLQGSTRILSGEYAGGITVPRAVPPQDPPLVVYAGRMIPEKRVTLLVDAIDMARRSIPRLQAVLFGKGPELERVQARIAELGLHDAIRLPGFASADEVAETMARSLCVVQPSSREGYGMVVVEASASGVPAIVVDGEDNAAVELIEPGQNGFVARMPKPHALSEQIIRCWRAGDALRKTTREWYGRNAARLSLERSLEEVIEGYRIERSNGNA